MERFKGYIMAVTKVLGLYQSIPLYRLKSVFLIIVLFLPLTPVIYDFVQEDQFELSVLGIFYSFFYLIVTVYIGQKISSIGRKWPQKEYDKMTLDLALSRFIFLQVLYAIPVYTLFLGVKYVVNMLL